MIKLILNDLSTDAYPIMLILIDNLRANFSASDQTNEALDKAVATYPPSTCSTI